MNGMAWTAVATVIAAGFTFVGVLATQRAARTVAATTAQATIVSSREQAEQDAYDRARRTLESTIDRQDAEIAQLEAEVRVLRDEQRSDREELRRTRGRLDETAADLAETKRVLGQTQMELASTRDVLTRTEENLAAAEQLLKKHYPDV